MEDKKTTLDRASVVDKHFINSVQKLDFPASKSKTTLYDANLSINNAINIFLSQLESRQLDFIARILKNEGKSFYTIGSSGHEGNAAIASAFSIKDMAFLHYRSCAFMLQRARDHFGDSLLRDHILAIVASKMDPISSGRHKVFGSLALNVPPQTSTIGSHLPKALGAAFSIPISKSIGIKSKLESDSVILCSFGDGSLNHSTVQGALNSAQWIVAHNLPLPIVFICEDNGLAISVPTQKDWVFNTCHNRVGIKYIACDGLNIADVYKAAKAAEHHARKHRQPVFLHMKTVRLLGHAGSDIEFHYNTADEILQRESDDPLLHTAKMLISNGILTKEKVLSLYEETKQSAESLGREILQQPKHTNYKTIIADIIPPKLKSELPVPDFENKPISKISKNPDQKYNMAQTINFALDDLMAQYKNIVIFGEDIGKKGGVYRVTANLQKKYGAGRVFDTLLDEQTILGTAIGFAHNNILPIPEIQFLAYLHNAVDQIRGEAATLSFFSSGQFTNPMVVRIPGLAYQKGFGGHFHNDNAIAFLREIPGIVIACPSSPKLAALMLRKAVALAYKEQRVVIFLEPIALYYQKDIYADGDNEFLEEYPEQKEIFDFGSINIIGNQNSEIAIVTFGNGVLLSKQAVRIISKKYNIDIKIMDLCWLNPINFFELNKNVKNCKDIIIVDETRETGSVAESLAANFYAEFQDNLPTVHTITAKDSFIPLGDAWKYVLPSANQIVKLFEQKVLSTKQSNSSLSINWQ